jgi:hypothetical protein
MTRNRRAGRNQPMIPSFNPSCRQPTVPNHLQILFLARTRPRIAPINLHPLPTVQIQQFFREYLHDSRFVQRNELLKRKKIDVVGAVYRERDAEDLVRDWKESSFRTCVARDGARVDPPGTPRRSSELSSTSSISRLAAWSISTVSVMTWSRSAAKNASTGQTRFECFKCRHLCPTHEAH